MTAEQAERIVATLKSIETGLFCIFVVVTFVGTIYTMRWLAS